MLKQSDFDESTLGGKTIGGVAVYNTEENKISGYIKLENFVPLEATAILPYFEPEKGEPFVFGSNKIGDYFYGADGADYSELDEYRVETGYVLVDGYMGRSMHIAHALEKDAYFRSVTSYPREAGQHFTYHFTFVNRSESGISFTVYNMLGGHNWKDTASAVASDPVTLAAGESKNVSIAVGADMSKDDSNTLTLIRMDVDATEVKLDVAMSIENTTPTQPAKITLVLPEGFVVKDYVTDVRTNDKLVLPKASQIENNTGHKILRWEYEDGTAVVEGVRLKGDITIRPVLTEDAFITFSDMPEGFSVTEDYVTKLQTGDKLVLPTAAQIKNTTGRNFVRWVYTDGTPVENGTVLTGSITIKPELSQPAKITVSLPSSLKLSSDYKTDAQTGDILAAPTSAQISGTLPDGRAVGGWYIVGSNEVITDKTVIKSTAVTIAPYYTRRENTAVMCNYSAENRNGNPLVFGNLQTSQRPMNVYNATNGAAAEKFDPIPNKWQNSVVVGGGADGYTELGNIISYPEELQKGTAFRYGTIVSADESGNSVTVVQKNVEHTFIYNFQNYGNTVLSFTVQQTNSGADVEGEKKDVVLAPGESTTVTLKVAYTKGSANKNVITYFTINQDVTGMRLGISINAMLKANVSLKNTEGFTLNPSYTDKAFYIGGRLTLPAEGDYTDSKSENRTLLGWKDGGGNALEGGEIISASNTVLVPVFEEFAVVTVKLPEGVTLNGYEASKKYALGDKLVLPTQSQITSEKKILYWIIDGTSAVVDNETVLEANITITPVLESDRKQAVVITAAADPNFTVSQDYLNKTQYKGELLVLPKEGEYTNNYAGQKVVGWKDKTTDTVLTEGMPITLDSITLVPVLAEMIKVEYRLPSGVTLDSAVKTAYDSGEKLALPSQEQLSGSAHGVPAGWLNAESGAKVTADTVVTEAMSIVPYWQKASGYEYVQVGSGSASGYNTDKTHGNFDTHSADGTLSYSGHTGNNQGTYGEAAVVSGGADGYAMLGSVLSDTAPVTAGSMIRFDSKQVPKLTATAAVEFRYLVENRGKTALKLSIYQIASSSEYKVGNYYGYESRYRTEVELNPGESKAVVGQYKITANNNWLTLVVFERDVESFSFGFAISAKTTGSADVAAEYENQPASANTAAISYNPEDNEGITVSDSYLTRRVGHFVTAPAAGDITVPEGVTVGKWQLVIGGETYDLSASVTDWKNVRLPSAGATLKAFIIRDLTVSYAEANGVSTDGAKTAYKTNETLALPALADATSDGRSHLGWFDVKTGRAVADGTAVTDNMALAPYFAPATGALTPLSGAKEGEDGCTFGPDNISPTDTLLNQFVKTENIIGGDEPGIRLDCKIAMEKDWAFRFKTAYSVQAKTYTFTVRFTNYGSDEVSFTVYQLKSSTVTAGMPSKSVTLASGATDTAELTLTFTGTNANALTYFVMNAPCASLSLGVSMSVAEVAA